MLQWALDQGFPRCTVLADLWFGIDQFIRELKRLKLDYILEIKSNYSIKKPCEAPKRTPKGRLAKNQYDVIKLPEYFESILTVTKCGLEADLKTGKREKVLYHAKIVTAKLKSTSGKHRIVESTDRVHQTTKYCLTSHLNWESIKILYDNLEAVVDKLQNDENFLQRWLNVERENVFKLRKKRKTLVEIEQEGGEDEFELVANKQF